MNARSYSSYIADLKNKEAYHSPVANKNDKGESIKFTWASVKNIKSKNINIYHFHDCNYPKRSADKKIPRKLRG